MMPPRSTPASSAATDAVFAEATRWHARLREPDADAPTHEAFQAWLAGHPSHFDAYEQADRLWMAMGRTPEGRRDEAAIAALIESASPRRRRLRTVVATLLMCGVIGGAEWMRRGGLDDLRADYVTRIGTREAVELSDGSLVELNTDTAIAVDLDAGERRIRLFRGEAFFQVVRDPQRPFLVHTAEGEVRVTGTSFNVRMKGDVTEVGLVQGAVQLTAATDPNASLTLAPGQEGDISPQGLGELRSFDPASVTAWRRGQMVFFRTPLGKVIEELNRYQRGRIMILGENLRALPVTGVFDTRDPAAVIDMIEATLGLSSLRLTNALMILH